MRGGGGVCADFNPHLGERVRVKPAGTSGGSAHQAHHTQEAQAAFKSSRWQACKTHIRGTVDDVANSSKAKLSSAPHLTYPWPRAEPHDGWEPSRRPSSPKLSIHSGQCNTQCIMCWFGHVSVTDSSRAPRTPPYQPRLTASSRRLTWASHGSRDQEGRGRADARKEGDGGELHQRDAYISQIIPIRFTSLEASRSVRNKE